MAVWTRNDPQFAAPTPQIFVEGAYSTNGGQSWNSLPGLGLGAVRTDPNSPATAPTSYTQVTDASVAFDRNGRFYVLTSQHLASTGPNSPNALVLTGYDFTTNNPNQFLNKVVYQSTQDMALTPMLAIDDNATGYTDTYTVGNGSPQSHIQSNPFSGNIYVAWATNDQPHQNAVNFNANRILMVASSDGGNNFSGPVVLNSNGNSGGTGNQRATTPKLAISQGRPANLATGDPGVPGGQVTVVYDDFNSRITSNPPRDAIWSTRTLGAAAQSFNNTGVQAINAGLNTSTLNVLITNANFLTLSDLSVGLILTHASVNDLNIQLTAPDGVTSITLTPNGGAAAGGVRGEFRCDRKRPNLADDLHRQRSDQSSDRQREQHRALHGVLPPRVGHDPARYLQKHSA